MENSEFDETLVTAVLAHAGLVGWRGISIVEAARAASLPLDQARRRFPGPGAVLMRFGVMADAAALAEPVNEPLARDRLFDLLMRRFDVLQAHRSGMLALLAALPADPLLSVALAGATLRSMGWMLEAAGISAHGFQGQVRANALVAVWLYAVRAWRDDESADLAATMAALDKALDQAERFSGMFGGASATTVDDPLEGVMDVPAADVVEEPEAQAPARLMNANPPPPPADPPPPSP